MQVICSQAELARALRALSRITKKELYPLYQSVLFTARCPTSDSDQGMLTLLGIGMYGMVGMVMHIPATVNQDGQVLVPIEPLSEYVGGLRPGTLTLQYERAEPLAEEEQAQSPVSQALPALTMLFPLQIRSVYRSTATNVSTNQAHVAVWRDWEEYPQPPIQQWLTTRVPMAVLPASFFKDAIARCAPFANKGKQGKGETTELEGILVSLTHDTIAFSAATRTMLINHRLPLHQPSSFSFTGLFPGKALAWMKDSLVNGEVALALAHDEQTHKDVFFLSTEQMTWFCRSLDVPIPSAWASALHLPHETELFIERRELRAPLKFFAGPVAATYQALSLVTEGKSLNLSMFSTNDTTMQEQREIHLLQSSAELSILVNPKQFKELVHHASGDLLLLQIGYFHRQEGGKSTRIDFLRIVSEQTVGIMSLSQRVPPSLSLVPAPGEGVSLCLDAKPPLALQEA